MYIVMDKGALIMEKEIYVYNREQIIFHEGANEPWMYVVEAGKVGIYARYGRENAKRLTVLEPGQYFGEMGMLDVMARSATAVALEDGTRVAKITSEDFGEYYFDHPEKILEIMRNMSSRIRDLTTEYTDACRAADEMTRAEGKEATGWLKTQLEKLRRVLRDHITVSAEYENRKRG